MKGSRWWKLAWEGKDQNRASKRARDWWCEEGAASLVAAVCEGLLGGRRWGSGLWAGGAEKAGRVPDPGAHPVPMLGTGAPEARGGREGVFRTAAFPAPSAVRAGPGPSG